MSSIKGRMAKALSNLIWYTRESKGISQEAMAKKLKCPQKRISHMESGSRSVHAAELPDIARALREDPTHMFSTALKWARRLPVSVRKALAEKRRAKTKKSR